MKCFRSAKTCVILVLVWVISVSSLYVYVFQRTMTSDRDDVPHSVRVNRNWRDNQENRQSHKLDVGSSSDAGHHHTMIDTHSMVSASAVKRPTAYCNPIEKLLLGEEGKPNDLLINVHIITRHGDRSSMSALPLLPKNHMTVKCNAYNLSDSQAQQFVDLTDYLWKHDVLQIKHKSFSVRPNRSVCVNSELTPLGALQHYHTGQYLRSKYWHRLFTVGPVHEKYLYIRSTTYSRTFQSAVGFLTGFLHKNLFNISALPIILHSVATKMCSEQLAGVSCSCPIIQKLSKVKDVDYEAYMAKNALFESIKTQVWKALDVEARTLPWIPTLLDAMMPYVCHNMSLPCGKTSCVSWSLLNQMWDFVDQTGLQKIQSEVHKKINTLRAFPLINEICNRLKNVSLGLQENKLSLYSGHDSTLLPLLVALRIHDGKWTPYASRLIFELYKIPVDEHNRNVTFALRVLYNGEDKTAEVHMCNSKLRNGLCPLDQFCDSYKYRKQPYDAAEDYTQACQGNYN